MQCTSAFVLIGLVMILTGFRLSSCQNFTKLLNVVVVEKAWTVAILFPETTEHIAVCGLHEWITQTVL